MFLENLTFECFVKPETGSREPVAFSLELCLPVFNSGDLFEVTKVISSADTCGTSRNRSEKWGGEAGRHEMFDYVSYTQNALFSIGWF